MEIEGVKTIVQLDHGIGVVASSVESGLKAKRQMQIKCSEALASTHNSNEDLSGYTDKGAKEERHEGDVRKSDESC